MLPNTYRQLEYLQSTGTQYINTGIVPSSNLKIQIKYRYDTNTTYSIIGTRGLGESEIINYRLFRYNSQFYVDMGNGSSGGNNRITGGTCSVNTIYNLELANHYLKNIDTGVNIISGSTLSTFTYSNAYTLKLFQGSRPFNAETSYFTLWYCKIYDSNTLVRDLIPVKRISDNVLGMYDLVNDVFYTNVGTGTFIGGAELPKVTTSVSPQGSGSVTGDGYYEVGDSVTLTATPNPNSTFDKFVLNGYKKLDYIESSGTQYIDTGLHIPYANIGFDLDFMWTEQASPTARMMFGVRDTINASNRAYNVICSIVGDNYAQDGYSYTTWATWGQSKATGSHLLGMAYNQRGTISFRNTDGILHKADGTSETLSQRTISTLTTYSPYIFATNENGSPFLNNAKAKLYSAKIYNNDTLVRDYIPVKRTSDDAVGLLDLVNLKFYANNGTGSFTYGSEVGEVELPTYTELDYIESSGTQYIDTGEAYNCDTDELEYEFEWVSVSGSTYDKAFGTLDNSGAILHQWDYQDGATNQSIAYGYNSTNYKHSFGYALNTDYEVVVNKSGMTVNGVPTTFLTQATNSTITSIYLFALHYNGTYTQPSRIRLKKFIHRRNGTEIRSFIPVKRNDSTIGLFDLVNLKFYANNGTGSFTYGSEVGALPITSFTITEDVDVTAYFLNLGHSVTLLVNPLGYGSVTGDGSYPQGASVTIEAIPNTHKIFVNWTENGVVVSTSNPYTFTMGNTDVSYTANFVDAEIYTIDTNTFPSTLPLVWQSDYEVYQGDSVTLRARDVDGYVFSHWSNGSTSNPYTFEPTASMTLTANYLVVPQFNDVYQFRAYIKSQTDVEGLPIAFIEVRSFTIRRDLLASATSDFSVPEVPTDVSNGDILVLYDAKGKVYYEGIIVQIEDSSIQCTQIQSFYKGTWVYDTHADTSLEGEFAYLLTDFANGWVKGSSYQDTLIQTEKGGLSISTNSSTAVSLPTDDRGVLDMESFIYELYEKYGLITDIQIAYENGGYTTISIPNYSAIKVGNNTESVLNLSPLTEVAETNKLIVFAEDGTYRSTFVYTSTNGIVEEPVTNVGRYGVVKTSIVYSNDAINDIVSANLPSTMYNHHLTFDLLLDGNLYNFNDFKLGMPIQVWNGTDYYSTVFTGYEMSCGEGERPTSVHMVCGKVRLALTQKLLIGGIR